MSAKLPKLVLDLCINFDAWIVGSAADPEVDTPRDYDVQVPFSEWGKASSLIPEDAKRNHFGGWKCDSEGFEVDVWPGELGWLMQAPQFKYAYHPRSGTRVNKFNS